VRRSQPKPAGSPIVLHEGPFTPTRASLHVDAVELADLKGEFLHASMSIDDVGKITIIYPRGLVLRAPELRLYLGARKN